jgi:hypothetical protein
VTRKLLLACVALLALSGGAFAQADTTTSIAPDGRQLPGFVVFCRPGNATSSVPCGGTGSPFFVMTMPFTRLHSAPIRLKGIGQDPKSFPITRPVNATTYRIINPCDVDIRLLGTMSATDAVTEDTGVLYLARTESTMGTSRPNFISAMTVGAPTGDCTPEMHYGVGGG